MAKKDSDLKNKEYTPFEERKDLKKLLFYVVIVNYGQGDNIIKIMKENHSSAQFIQLGEGTASSQIRDVLNIEDNRKEIVYCLIRNDYVKELVKELNAYFLASKKNRGMGFSVELDSIVGVKLYKFFTQTVRG